MTTDLRFPIGKFARPAALTAEERTAAIARIAAHPAALRAAVQGLDDAQLNTPYRPDGWTVRQLVHHMADSHINAYARTRMALTEATPTIKPYDEEPWAELWDARSLPVEVSLGLVDGLHERWVALLRHLEPAAFARTMVHPANGPMTIDVQLALYAWHCEHHVAHVTALRSRNGW